MDCSVPERVLVRLLLVGLGGIGQRHVRNLRMLLGTEADLIAYRVRGHSPALTDVLSVEPGIDPAEKYGLRVFSSLDAALAERPRAALVCNPSGLHMPIAIQAAAAGCGLFIEKPLSDTIDGVGTLANTVAAHGSVGLVGYQLRFHPCLRRLKAILDEGLVGNVLAARFQVGEYLPGWHAYEDYRQMYASRSDLGGGVVLSQIHELDLVYWLFGMPKQVFAVGGHLSDLEVDVEDTSSALLECRVDGRPLPVHVHQDYAQRPPARTIDVIGDAGKIAVDLRESTLTRFAADGAVGEVLAIPDFQRNSLFLDEMRHFLACLDGREQPEVDLRDGLMSLRIALAIKQSLASGGLAEIGADDA